MKKYIKIIAALLIVAISLGASIDANACELSSTRNDATEGMQKSISGYLDLSFEESPIQIVEQDLDDVSLLTLDNEDNGAVCNKKQLSSSNSYIYNQLNDVQKSLWDGLEAECEKINSCDDYVKSPLVAGYNASNIKSEYVIQPGITIEDGQNVVSLFRYCHPQYFFLNTRIGWGKTNKGNYAFSLGVYSAFNEPTARLTAKNQIDSVTNEIIETANIQTKEDFRAKEIHDSICSRVSYCYEFERADRETRRMLDESLFTQSIYSVFVLNSTVCAGYAQAFQYLCSLSGLDSISITSAEHQWNLVLLDGNWYQADLTWDDLASQMTYEYFLRSDSFMKNHGDYTNTMHTVETKWNGYLPECKRDAFYPNGTTTFYGINANYCVEYIGNGADDGKMEKSTFAFYKSEKLRKNDYKKQGYNFVGWNLEKDGSGDAFDDQSTVENLADDPEETIKLYAQWEKNESDSSSLPSNFVIGQEEESVSSIPDQNNDVANNSTKLGGEKSEDVEEVIEITGEIDDDIKANDKLDNKGSMNQENNENSDVSNDNKKQAGNIWNKIAKVVKGFFAKLFAVIKGIFVKQ